jgi:MFS family permease
VLNPTSTRGPAAGRLPSVYRVWLVGALVSQLGDSVLYFALGWVASAAGGSAAGLVLTSVALPRTVLLLAGGVAGDQAGARRVMITGDAVMLLVTAALGAVACWWGTPLPVLVATGLVIGTVDAFYLPSLGSMPRRLVADDQLTRAVAVRQSGGQLVTMIGGPAGGALVALAGLGVAAWADAASFAAVLVVLIVIRPRFGAPAAPVRESVLRSAADGLRVAARTPGLGPALLLVAGAAGFVLPGMSLVVPLLARGNHWGAAAVGVLVGAQGTGVIASALVVARRGSASRPGIAAAAGLAAISAGQLVMALLHPVMAAVACAVLIGAGSGTLVSNLAPVLLGTAPRTHLARIQSLLSLVQSSALLVTNNVLGAVAHLMSAPAAMLCCSAAVAGCSGVALGTPALRQLAGRPSGPAGPPA